MDTRYTLHPVHGEMILLRIDPAVSMVIFSDLLVKLSLTAYRIYSNEFREYDEEGCLYGMSVERCTESDRRTYISAMADIRSLAVHDTPRCWRRS